MRNRIQTSKGRGLHRQIVARPLLVLFAVVLLAILNPLLCVIHCYIGTHATAGNSTHLHQVGFFCDLPQAHEAQADSTHTPPLPAPAPRAVYELAGILLGVQLGLVLLIAFVAPICGLKANQIATAPPLPPPRPTFSI